MAVIRRRTLISGRVQGVAFRHYTRNQAEKVGVDGWVRNLPDGRVEAVFEGDAEQVEHMVRWCRNGPPSAHVENVEVKEETPQGNLAGFDITFAR